mmetsp:Transcript_6023/g.19345  ORF Transcript_6023/g.19345 Transcript_6023/m.19345 type:complete len:242 (-) Transcript_6023:621-1346(-)
MCAEKSVTRPPKTYVAVSYEGMSTCTCARKHRESTRRSIPLLDSVNPLRTAPFPPQRAARCPTGSLSRASRRQQRGRARRGCVGRRRRLGRRCWCMCRRGTTRACRGSAPRQTALAAFAGARASSERPQAAHPSAPSPLCPRPLAPRRRSGSHRAAPLPARASPMRRRGRLAPEAPSPAAPSPAKPRDASLPSAAAASISRPRANCAPPAEHRPRLRRRRSQGRHRPHRPCHPRGLLRRRS